MLTDPPPTIRELTAKFRKTYNDALENFLKQLGATVDNAHEYEVCEPQIPDRENGWDGEIKHNGTTIGVFQVKVDIVGGFSTNVRCIEVET